jgi:hypothetical protein
MALRNAPYAVKPIEVADGLWMVGYNATDPDVDHNFAAGVMRYLIGEFEDITTPADDLQQILAHAIRSAKNPRALADQLMVAIIDAAGTGHAADDWSPSDQASNEMYRATSTLIGETFRRHVEAARAAGDPAQAARDMLAGLTAAVELCNAEYTRPEMVDGAR